MKVNAVKDGKGNIVISEDSFEMLLNCLDNQKFVGEQPQNGDSISVGKEAYWKGQQDIQDTIDQYNRSCRDILHQKYVFDVTHDGLSLFKKYEHQDEIIPWSGKDVGFVYSLFEDTIREYKKSENLSPITDEECKEGDTPLGVDEDGWIHVEPKQDEPWLIERPLRYDGKYLTISEDGTNNRPWEEEEIKRIKELFN
jgi:hypothetical protein